MWPFFAAEVPPPTPDDVFECDYERDCTTLYRAMEAAVEPKEFEPVITFLDTGYWPGSFFADSVAPSLQVRTWVTRFDDKDATKVKWSQLPIHLAIVCNAPPAVIGRLVKLYPQALRCTDDQHMLPLHLALRHGASDEVISYMLMQFPDAVNAKGKNGRTAIDCALRSKDKLRGKILEIFVEKSKGKKSAAIVKEQEELKEELMCKNEESLQLRSDLEELANSYEAIKALKEAVEMDLLKKIQDLEQSKAELEADFAEKIGRLESEKLVESIEHQQKVEMLDVTNENLVASEKQARDSEVNLRRELESLHTRVAKSRSPDDWKALKLDVRALEATRLERNRKETKVQIDNLKGELEKTIWDIHNVESSVGEKSPKNELKSELKAIQQTVSKLERTETKSKSKEELHVLQTEIETLRAELKERADASRTRVELTVLKKAMEIELRNVQGKTEAELALLRQAVANANTSKLEDKTSEELASLKNDLDMMKKEIRNKELASKTKNELDDLCESLETEIKTVGSKGNEELAMMKKTAFELKDNLIKSAVSSDGIITVNKSVQRMKDDLKKKETTSKIIEEVAVLKEAVEAELKSAEGKTQKELLSVKQKIKPITEKELASKDVDELSKIKKEMVAVKSSMRDIESASKVQQELDFLKKALAKEMLNSAIKAERELSMMKKAVDEVNMEQKESKKLKIGLADEIKEANKHTEQQLVDLKKALDGLDVKKLESSNREGWNAIRAEMDVLKTELEAKQATRDLSPDIDYIKKTLAAFNLDKIESKTNTEFQSLRAEMNAMRDTIKDKARGEKELKQELYSLKMTTGFQKKKGLKKFFTRHFAYRKNNEVDPTVEEVKAALAAPIPGSFMTSVGSAASVAGGESVVHSTVEEEVVTIAPPSLANLGTYGDGSDSDESYSEDEASKADTPLPAKRESIPENASMKSNVSSKSTKTTTLPPLVPRKVISMDPRIASPTKSTTGVRTFIKPIVETIVDELPERVASNDTIEDDVLVKSPTNASTSVAVAQ